MTEFSNSRVLIQTDHPEDIPFLRMHLEQMNLQVTLVDNHQAVLEQLACETFDLLLLDAHRLDILEQIRAAGCDSPVIVLARLDEIQLAEQCLALGAQDYLHEPYNPGLLQVRVTGCLERHAFVKNQQARERMLHLQHDIDVARRIQENFLPRELPRVPGWELQALFYPAREVAGDWYDAFFMSGKRRVGFVVADVCDKGMPSALFMALCRSLLRAFSQQNMSLRWMDTQEFSSGDWLNTVKKGAQASRNRRSDDPLAQIAEQEEPQRALLSAGTTSLKSAVNLTNKYIIDNHSDSNMFFTMFFGTLDPSNGNVFYINAGHNPPYVLDKNGSIKARLKPTGPAVGVIPGARFEIGQVDLEPGDLLYAFTDGVPDAANPQGEHYGDKRLSELVRWPGLSAKALLNLVDHHIHNHILDATQFDDITMIALRYLGG
ncbi:MAG: SpoIIE family protein phosphatase [Chloroflexota bacterium]